MKENQLIGQTFVEDAIEVDQDQWLAELENEINTASPQTDGEKIELAARLVKSHLKDALNPTQTDYVQHQEALKRAWGLSAKMSEIVEGGYGVCSHFHIYGIVALESMGVEAAMYGNPKYHHTFLYTKRDGVWEILDPFAEVYFQNKIGVPKLFPQDCYIGDELVFFGKTTVTTDLPDLRRL